jgi:hypothetical protein
MPNINVVDAGRWSRSGKNETMRKETGNGYKENRIVDDEKTTLSEELEMCGCQ